MILSVIKQKYTNWELIIINNCSKDNSISIISKYLNDKRIKLYNLNPSTLYPISNIELKKPAILQEIFDISRKLSSDFNLVRVDFIVSKDLSDFMISEITNYYGGANEKFLPKDSENLISNIIYD